jgi:hypothetical protein
MAATFAPVPHLRVVHRDQPIRRYLASQRLAVVARFNLGGQPMGLALLESPI